MTTNFDLELVECRTFPTSEGCRGFWVTPDHSDGQDDGGYTFRVEGLTGRYSVFFVEADAHMHTRPVRPEEVGASLQPEATVISTYRDPFPPATIQLRYGDTLTMMGDRYEVRRNDRDRHYPILAKL